jgi:hypothetical protein
MPSQAISQTPDPLNITVRQSQEWNIGFSYTNQDGTTIDLLGYTPELQIRTSALAKTVSQDLTVGHGLTFTHNTTPQVQVSTTINLAPGKYEWDLRLTATGQGAIFLGRGTMTVDAEVTR